MPVSKEGINNIIIKYKKYKEQQDIVNTRIYFPVTSVIYIERKQ